MLTIYLTASDLYTSRKDPTSGVSERPAAQQLAGQASTDTAPSSESDAPETSESNSNTPTERTALLSHQNAHSNRPILSRQSTATYESLFSDGSRFSADFGQASSNARPLPTKVVSTLAAENRKNAALAPRKTLYFGSGSGISEVKCILSGFVIHGFLGAWTRKLKHLLQDLSSSFTQPVALNLMQYLPNVSDWPSPLPLVFRRARKALSCMQVRPWPTSSAASSPNTK